MTFRRQDPASRLEQLAEVVDDPAAYAWGFFGRRLWEIQTEIVDSVFRNPRTTVRACTGSGKTMAAAVAGAEWITKFPDGVVLVTASRWAQVQRQFFKEVRALVRDGRHLVAWPAVGLSQWVLGEKRFMVGMSPSSETGMGGYHEAHMLVIIDEASDVEQFIYDGAEGPLSAGHASLLELGNPLVPKGPFYEHHTKEAAEYRRFKIAVWDTPNFAWLGGPEVPREEKLARLMATPDHEVVSHIVNHNLTSPLWVKGRFRVWGTSHPAWQARVEADFPDESIRVLVPMTWADRAADGGDLIESLPLDTPLVGGIDVAGGGRNRTVIWLRAGDLLLPPMKIEATDALGPALHYLRPFKERIRLLGYDAGGLGHHFGPRLHAEGYRVRPFLFGEAAKDPERFATRGDELRWGVRERFEENRVRNFTDDDAYAQVTSITWNVDGRGRTVVLKKELAESPDELDALSICLGISERAGRITDKTIERLAGVKEHGPHRTLLKPRSRLSRWREM